MCPRETKLACEGTLLIISVRAGTAIRDSNSGGTPAGHISLFRLILAPPSEAQTRHWQSGRADSHGLRLPRVESAIPTTLMRLLAAFAFKLLPEV